MRLHKFICNKKNNEVLDECEENTSPECHNDNTVFEGYVDFSKLKTTSATSQTLTGDTDGDDIISPEEYTEYTKSLPTPTDEDDPDNEPVSISEYMSYEVLIEDLLELRERLDAMDDVISRMIDYVDTQMEKPVDLKGSAIGIDDDGDKYFIEDDVDPSAFIDDGIVDAQALDEYFGFTHESAQETPPQVEISPKCKRRFKRKR